MMEMSQSGVALVNSTAYLCARAREVAPVARLIFIIKINEFYPEMNNQKDENVCLALLTQDVNVS